MQTRRKKGTLQIVIGIITSVVGFIATCFGNVQSVNGFLRTGDRAYSHVVKLLRFSAGLSEFICGAGVVFLILSIIYKNMKKDINRQTVKYITLAFLGVAIIASLIVVYGYISFKTF